jgi:MYXO-CTERM domain-containing protein
MRLLLAALLCTATASAATTTENVAKYQALRSRLDTEFVVTGDAAGMSQPADERIEPQGIIRWSDSTIGLGWYIGMLATEHHLLSHPEQFPGAPGSLATTTDELYFALRAMERLDRVADAAFPPPCTQTEEVNGFFLRDDVPAGFHTHFPPMTAMTSDFSDPTLTNKEMSQDQVYHVLLGLALVKALVPPQTFAKGIDLRLWAADQGRRIIEHVSKNGWAITNPACDNRLVNRGPAAGGYSHGTRAAAGFFTDGEWLPEVEDAVAFAWELCRDPGAPQYIDEDNLHMAMAIAAVGNGWGDTTATDLATLMAKEDWPAYPLAHRVIHGVDAAWCSVAPKVNARARAMIDELPAGSEPKSPLPGGPAAHGFTVWNRFIRGKAQHYAGSPNSEGIRYNGVDYLLLHNLYAIATPATWSGGNGPDVPACPPVSGPKPSGGSDDGGGGCVVSPRSGSSSGALAFALMVAGLWRMRRRRARADFTAVVTTRAQDAHRRATR